MLSFDEATSDVLTVRRDQQFVGTIARTPEEYVVIDAADKNRGVYESVDAALAALSDDLR
ncbi:hypothetical protein [Cryobacterium arcticum]|uniref:hypothetical protein n=1 Tax=Cryobacterium arcticum TaxID=670052 RepID=UPI0012ED855E|nr:hypothetical protein [Cryobacterium arcticum]